MECSKCGAENSAQLTNCEYCGTVLPGNGQTAYRPAPAVANAAPPASPASGQPRWTNMAPYYQTAFDEFDRNNGGYLLHWNWAAFFGSYLWYLVKGLWVRFILMNAFFIYCALHDAVLAGYLISMLYSGGFGTYHYYKRKRNQ